MMQRLYCLDRTTPMKTLFDKCLWESVSPNEGCNMFEACFIQVTEEERGMDDSLKLYIKIDNNYDSMFISLIVK